MTDTTTDSILFALYCLCRDNRHVDATELGLAASVSPTLAAATLVELERTGLVDASRARLTMLGLARACQLEAGSSQGGPRVSLGQSRPRMRASAALPVAAQSVVPPAQPKRERERSPEAMPVVAYLQGHA